MTKHEMSLEIVKQIAAQLPVGMKAVYLTDEERSAPWIRVHIRRLRRNIDITYNQGSDLYGVEIHDIPTTDGMIAGKDVETRCFDGIYVDTLGQIASIPRKGSNRTLFQPRDFPVACFVG